MNISRALPMFAIFLLASCSLPFADRREGEAAAMRALAATAHAGATTTANQPIASPSASLPRSTAVPLPTLPPQPTLAPELGAVMSQQESLLIALYQRASPAVVSIEVRVASASDLPADHPTLPDSQGLTAQGSGFLYDDQGHIVTNNHVVEDSTALQVRFADGSTALAKLIGTDPDSDLAVIKVDRLPPGAAPLQLSDSREVMVGQTAVAIGNPFGEQNTLTVGVISGVGRTLAGPSRADGRFSIPNIIQTDASINPGNSGGPLLNIRGEVVGVNTAIAVSSGSSNFEGVGYAVPSSAVARIVPALISSGRYDHPWMGISMYSIDTFLAEQFNLSSQSGVLITQVSPLSPAAEAGLRGGEQPERYNGGPLLIGGDIITAINGQPVGGSDDLIGYLELEFAVGDTITLSIIRDAKAQDVQLTLEARR